MRFWTITILLALAIPSAALGDAPKPEPMPVPPVHAYGDTHPGCAEWSDGCTTCLRGADGPKCSTPGIACQPGEIICRKPSK